MQTQQTAFVGDEFRPGFRLQRSWDWSMATSFYFGEAGAGLFLVSLFYEYLPGLILGLLITSVGKTTGHLTHMGQPLRSWRAIFRLDRSWISRGLLAIVLFTGFGIIHILDQAGLTFGLLPAALRPTVIAIAAASAVVILLYQGFVMSHSAAIGLWSSALIPVLGLTYGLLGGVSLISIAGADRLMVSAREFELLRIMQIGLIFYIGIMLYSLIHAARFGSKGAQQSAELLLNGPMGKWFGWVVVVVGLVLPVAAIAFVPDSMAIRAATALAVMLGYYAFRVLVFKAGVFDPIPTFLPQVKRIHMRRV